MRAHLGRLSHRKGNARLVDDDGKRLGRRGIFQAAAQYGLAVPAAYLMAGDVKTDAAPMSHGTANDPPPADREPKVRIVRDFADPHLELLRLTRDATEIEHALLLQYLYAAFTVKPKYEKLVGSPGDQTASTLVGVAIQEMQHLTIVNSFLVALGGAPNLMVQEFPFDPDIYPFTFNLEPLSRLVLAKYVYAEAPPDVLDWEEPKGDDVDFVNAVWSQLGPGACVNHLGSLYTQIITVTRELGASGVPGLPDLTPWIAKLEAVMKQGEVDHYRFFRSVFMGTHEAFKGQPNIWDLSPLDPVYPAMQVEKNPSAYVGHPGQIHNPTALSIAWLGNLHYWIALSLLDLHFREISAPAKPPETGAGASGAMLTSAEIHMQGPLWSIGRHLPTLGVGMPFDPLGTGYASGRDSVWNRKLVLHLLGEAERLEKKLDGKLPADFPAGVTEYTSAALRKEVQQSDATPNPKFGLARRANPRVANQHSPQ
jgi:hypothetical protein